jgi:hypothetical protein
MFRLRIPQMIYAADEFHLRPKEDDDQTMGMTNSALGESKSALEGTGRIKGFGKMREGQMIRATIQWDGYLKQFDQVPDDQLSNEIAVGLLQQSSTISAQTMKKYIDASNRDNLIKSTSIQIMSTPEYQLC